MCLTAIFLVTIFESPGVFPIPNLVKSSCVRYFASSSLRTQERLTSSIAYSQLKSPVLVEFNKQSSDNSNGKCFSWWFVRIVARYYQWKFLKTLVVLSLIRFKLKELKLCSVNIMPLWHYVYNDDDKDSECFLVALSMHRGFNPLRKRWSNSRVWLQYSSWLRFFSS